MSSRLALKKFDSELKSALYRHIKAKYGSLYGNIEKELEYFVRIGLALEKFEDYPTKISFLSGSNGLEIEESSTHKNLPKKERDIIRAFDKELNLSNRISNDQLIDFLECTMGRDKRTVEKWTKYLIKIGFIKKESLLYWVNDAPVDIYDIYPELAPVEVKHD